MTKTSSIFFFSKVLRHLQTSAHHLDRRENYCSTIPMY